MGIIDDVLHRLTIDKVLDLLPDNYELNGHDYEGPCPSGHKSESNKSFRINTIDPTFHCWNCGASGNYIHLIELSRYGKSSNGSGWSDTFADTTKMLAEELGIETHTTAGPSVRNRVFEAMDHITAIYQSFMTDSVRGILTTRYGWDNEFIAHERIGYGRECPSKHLADFFTVDELLSTGLFNKTKTGGIFHIYQDRIVFPYIISGQVKYSIGRKTDKTTWSGPGEAPKYFKQYIHKKEREHVSEDIKNIIIKCRRDNGDVFIAEGIADYLQLKRFGINAMSAVTVQFKKEHYDQVIEECRKFKRVFICNDNDENNSGQNGSYRIAEKLVQAGIVPFVIELPRLSDKMDAAEFIRDHGIEPFLNLKQSAVSYFDLVLRSLPFPDDKSKIPSIIEPLLELLSYAPTDFIDIFISDRVNKHFGLSKSLSFLTQLKKNTLAKVRARTESAASNYDEELPIDIISAGQDFLKGILYYTISKRVLFNDENGMRKAYNKIYVVSSDGQLKEAKDGQIITDTLIFNRKVSSEYSAERWAFGSDMGIKSFVQGNAEVNPATLFLEIRDFLNTFIFFKNPGTADHLALVIMASYHYMIFHSIGYIHLWAEKRSGKTTALEIMSELGFNALMSSSISDAAIFRIIEQQRPLLLIDEAENLNMSAKQRDNSVSERLELYKSGYKRNGSATRCEGQNNVVTNFSNYCIKGFSSIKSLDATLEDRSIVHEFKRMPADEKRRAYISNQHTEKFQEIRNRLYVYGLQNAKRLNEIYTDLEDRDNILEKNKITHRAREIWAPYLTVALLIDEFDPMIGCFDSQLALAKGITESKEAFSHDGGKPMTIIEKLYLWTKEIDSQMSHYASAGDIYPRKLIINGFIKNVLQSEDEEGEWAFVTYSYIKQILRRFHIVDKDSEIQRIQVFAERGVALVMDKKKMLEALSTYKPDHSEEVGDDIEKLLRGGQSELEKLGVD